MAERARLDRLAGRQRRHDVDPLRTVGLHLARPSRSPLRAGTPPADSPASPAQSAGEVAAFVHCHMASSARPGPLRPVGRASAWPSGRARPAGARTSAEASGSAAFASRRARSRGLAPTASAGSDLPPMRRVPVPCAAQTSWCSEQRLQRARCPPSPTPPRSASSSSASTAWAQICDRVRGRSRHQRVLDAVRRSPPGRPAGGSPRGAAEGQRALRRSRQAAIPAESSASRPNRRSSAVTRRARVHGRA